MATHLGFKIGDYVIADHALFDTFDGQTFKITELRRNLNNVELIKVVDIARPDSVGTSFYPSELSWEDGSRPDASAHTPKVNRGAW